MAITELMMSHKALAGITGKLSQWTKWTDIRSECSFPVTHSGLLHLLLTSTAILRLSARIV